MTPASVRDYIATLRPRYSVASRALKHQILDELCATAHYTRKGAIRALTHPPPARRRIAGVDHPSIRPPSPLRSLRSGKRPAIPGRTA